MNPVLIAAITAGSLLGGALAYLIWQLAPATPALAPALARLAPDGRTAVAESQWSVQARLMALVAADPSDLAVLGRTRGRYMASVGWSALVGLIITPLLAVAFSTGGDTMIVIPAFVGVLLAAVMALIAVRDVKIKAGKARREFRRGVKAYIKQVAAAVASGYGPQESLERAAEVGSGPVFDRIRATLNRARHQAEPPWEQLRELGDLLRVPALGDLGDNMQAAGASGADVHDTLRDAAASLRDQIRFDELAAAKKGTTTLDTLGAALLMVGIATAAYPLVLSMQIR